MSKQICVEIDTGCLDLDHWVLEVEADFTDAEPRTQTYPGADAEATATGALLVNTLNNKTIAIPLEHLESLGVDRAYLTECAVDHIENARAEAQIALEWVRP